MILSMSLRALCNSADEFIDDDEEYQVYLSERRPRDLDVSIDLVGDSDVRRYREDHPERFAFLLVRDVAEVLRVWRAWRGGRDPTEAQIIQAINHYADHDAFGPHP